MNNADLINNGIIRCVKCGSSEWIVGDNYLKCENCNHSYQIEHSRQLVTIENFIHDQNWEMVSDGFDLYKGNEKPIKLNKLGGQRIKDLRDILGIKGLAINLGSGKDCHEGFLNIDLGRYEHVNIVADLANVPIVSESAELVVSNSVLEHIYSFKDVIDEAHRILVPGGYFYLCVPNACVRHHKYDYHRWTTPGLLKLVNEKFIVIESGTCRGIAYSLIMYVEALLTFKIKNRFALNLSRTLWRFFSYPLFWIKDDPSEECQALS